MILKRQIVLKAIVTERLKREMVEAAQETLRRIQESQDELERQSRRLMLELQRSDLNRAMSYRQQLDAEKRKFEEARVMIQSQIQEIEGLELGTEIERGTLEGDVEIQVGDNIEEKLGLAEILMVDGIVKELRDPAPAPADAPRLVLRPPALAHHGHTHS